MVNFKDNEFDLAIVDPPFNLSVSSKEWYGSPISNTGIKRMTTTKFKEWDNKTISNVYFKELKRILWGANHYIKVINKNSSCWIVWDKKNESSTFADCELAWTSFKTAVRIFRYTWNGMIQEDMKNKEIRIHETQKPVALYRWLLQNYAKPNDTILDTHIGSGSSIIACLEEGFDITGYEIDKDYYDSVCKRIKIYESQLKIPF